MIHTTYYILLTTSHAMHSTLQLFRHLVHTLPPLFPPEVKERAQRSLKHLETASGVSLEEAEDAMISFGYELWPWRRAWLSALARAEAEMAEHFLMPKLSPELQEHCQEFKLYGGGFRDLHSGNAAIIFSSEERVELCPALITTEQQLRQYAAHQVLTLERAGYLARVAEYTLALSELKRELDSLRALFSAEQDHPQLAREIRERVRGFEQGLCALAPEPDYEAVCQSTDFFAGRKTELNRLKGIEAPLVIDWLAVAS